MCLIMFFTVQSHLRSPPAVKSEKALIEAEAENRLQISKLKKMIQSLHKEFENLDDGKKDPKGNESAAKKDTPQSQKHGSNKNNESYTEKVKNNSNSSVDTEKKSKNNKVSKKKADKKEAPTKKKSDKKNKSKTKAKAKGKSNPKAKSKTKPNSKKDPKSKPKSDKKDKTKSKAKAKAKPKSDKNAKTKSKSKEKSSKKPKSKSKNKTKASSTKKTKSKNKSDKNTTSESKPKLQSDTNSSTNSTSTSCNATCNCHNKLTSAHLFVLNNIIAKAKKGTSNSILNDIHMKKEPFRKKKLTKYFVKKLLQKLRINGPTIKKCLKAPLGTYAKILKLAHEIGNGKAGFGQLSQLGKWLCEDLKVIPEKLNDSSIFNDVRNYVNSHVHKK